MSERICTTKGCDNVVHPSKRGSVCNTCGVREYRSDPVKREADRERSRRWKREHLGQPGLPRKEQSA